MRSHLRYALITPVRNEAEFIEGTIRSLVQQTILPVRWVIVSDGSTDGTDDIVKKYLPEHPWIQFLRMPERRERDFGGKVHAFNAGYQQLSHLEYELIGNLDGDVTFEPDYFEYLLTKLAENPRLGLAGTNYCEGTLKYDYRFSSNEDVPGACHLFRRECFEAIQGYKPIKGGGIDLVAVLAARMNGWQTRAFAEKYLIHHRQQGTATAGQWKRHFVDGEHDYRFGGHPLWEIPRTIYRMKQRPYILSGILLFCGYAASWAKREKRPVSDELVRFRRKEQMQKLTGLLRRLMPFKGGACSIRSC